MGTALEAGYDLAGIAGCYLLIGLIAVVGFTFMRLADVLDISILGKHPFGGVATAIRNTIVAGCNLGIKKLEAQVTKFESGLIDGFGLVIAIPLLLFLGVRAALSYLWDHALQPLINAAVSPVRQTAAKAAADVNALERSVLDTSTALPGKISGAVSGALATAEKFTVDHVNALERELRRDLGADVDAVERKVSSAITTAERYADVQLGHLRDIEDAAVRQARDIAAAATAGAISRLEHELAGLRDDLTGALGAARGDLSAAIEAVRHAEESAIGAVRDDAQAALVQATAAAQAAIADVHGLIEGEMGDLRALEDAAIERARAASNAAIDQLRGVTAGIGADLGQIEGTLGAAGLAALIASIPALATLTHAIADEAGLGRPECRGKVKNICGVDPSRWAGMLSGLGLLGMTLDFRDLVDSGRELLHLLEEGGDAIGLGS